MTWYDNRNHVSDDADIGFNVVSQHSSHRARLLCALSVMDLSVILFIARALVRVSMLSNGQFAGVDTFSMADCFSPTGVTE